MLSRSLHENRVISICAPDRSRMSRGRAAEHRRDRHGDPLTWSQLADGEWRAEVDGREVARVMRVGDGYIVDGDLVGASETHATARSARRAVHRRHDAAMLATAPRRSARRRASVLIAVAAIAVAAVVVAVQIVTAVS
ncbi:hypothetical protein [Schumannella sp. 10F1B-5-1]|uniref:hypothetical protein n=1 Tax=Schumannella sp. 10F1B-5-1 TaxID=2590780 RepID=UPI001132295B|nr:hypothetical protein [Schumannella sp. 10F1B-5-1]TPW73010.1 hypothetical protein FJ658_07110 [Schumannella sp. 10F1B-5-1]